MNTTKVDHVNVLTIHMLCLVIMKYYLSSYMYLVILGILSTHHIAIATGIIMGIKLCVVWCHTYQFH